ncbi:MAG: hypothetical protein Q8903_08080, partial [Bacteroidota bacterium]|nr:hypothetical protein [Bacteroidota bacterium]
LIKIEWCTAARRLNDENVSGIPALGVDAANSIDGDKAAIALGRGNHLLSVEEFNSPDSNALGKNNVMSLVMQYKVDPSNIGIDGVGVGAGTVNALKEMKLNVVNIMGSASPVVSDSNEKFLNLRSQMYWQLREDLRNKRITFPNDVRLVSELTSIKWKLQNDKIAIESKEEIKKRIGHSPNLADAAVYWNWVRVPRKILNEVSVY